MKKLLATVVALLCLTPALTHAWWQKEWAQRKKITLNTADSGAALKEPLNNVVVPVRLHTGNFVFADAKPDGSDIRFVAADDKTPLKFYLESYDDINEIAVFWVQLPNLAANSASESIWMYHKNENAASAADPKGTFDPSHTLVMNFAGAGVPLDLTANGNKASQSNAGPVEAGLINGAAAFSGSQSVQIPASASLKINPVQGFTYTALVKPAAAQQNGILFSQQEGDRSLVIGLEQGNVGVRVAGVAPAQVVGTVPLNAGTWQHIMVSIGTQIAIYVDGKPAGGGPGAAPELGGEVFLGGIAGAANGFQGEMDEVRLFNGAKSQGWAQALAASQAADSKMVLYGEDESGEGGSSYFGILLGAVTLDGWIVIGILLVMMLVSWIIMATKSMFVARMDKANQAFLNRFRQLSSDMTKLDEDVSAAEARGGAGGRKTKGLSSYGDSSIYRLYHIAIEELRHRFQAYREKQRELVLTPQSINSIRASLDAGLVRETHRLNNQMVLLTIAISGGPFLGLLGTVVGVMITFAAIAAVGDVNINSIAPGIAAALVATVAGLAVAIPALFGYNYLASRIKNITADMQVFADELVTKIAENYSI
jgi:biopolymer transport protein ExbB